MLTHANLAANVQQILRYVGGREPGKDRILGILPLFHVFAMTAVMNLGIALGAVMILMPKFDVPGAVGLLRRKKPTILPGVPTLFTALLQYSRIRPGDLQSLTFCISGGASLPAELRHRFESFSGCRVVEGYGLSETSPVVALNPLKGLEKDGSIGQPLPLTIVAIRSLDDPRVAMPLGESGEICVACRLSESSLRSTYSLTSATLVMSSSGMPICSGSMPVNALSMPLSVNSLTMRRKALRGIEP